MPIRDDADEIGMTFLVCPSGSGPSIFGMLMAWSLGLVTVLEKLRSELDPYQSNILLKIIGQWGDTLSRRLSCADPIMVVPKAEVADLRSLFEKTYSLAAAIRCFRPMLPQGQINYDRDEAIIAQVRAFCDEKERMIDEFTSQTGDITCEGYLFEQLIHHVKSLIQVTLSDALMRRFTDLHDEMMGELRLIFALAQTPLS